MSQRKDKAVRVDSSGRPPSDETPPALDAIVDRVLAYKPPDSKGTRPKVGKKTQAKYVK